MSCFSCINCSGKSEINDSGIIKPGFQYSIASSENGRDYEGLGNSVNGGNRSSSIGRSKDGSSPTCGAAQSFSFRELATATKNFKPTNLIGEGGFGKVYKGILETGQIVAIKQLNKDSLQGNQEFIVEILMLSLLHHPHLVNLIGYCTDGDQRLLVYEFMPMGSLENHLFDLGADEEALDWNTRIKIGVGAARGLQYLHCKANPPVIYRDLKSANILLDNDFSPKLSDFGLAKLGPVGDKTHVSTRVMGTYGYCAPEYAMSGKLTLKSDIYSFGVMLMELVTGRQAIDYKKKQGEQNLISWSRPFLKDKRKILQLADPLLKGHFPVRCFQHAIAIAAMCLQEQPNFRPLIGDIVVALEYLASHPYNSEAGGGGVHSPPLTSPARKRGEHTQEKDSRHRSLSV
ncbi:hypothetical protein Syun_005617 [Stephania yunnanensis]|uniref:non-specific serine/threonine protein kinase n=1 Tax=Stephania yunnanensis TaxID=152371 RepID=A0AAP0L7S9_9MAGN